MHTHAFMRLTARVEGAGVRLSFYFTTPVFKSLGGPSNSTVLQIQRKSVPGFTWGRHYKEYFDGLVPGAADVLFEGPLKAINHRKFEYLDSKVKIGETYVYWVSCTLGHLPTGPVPVRIRDHHIWWPHHEVESRIAAMAQTYPGMASLKRYGTTVGGYSISGLIVGNGKNCIALVGTIHAGESGPELIIPAVERLLTDHADLLSQVGVAILPNVNVDNRERLIKGCPWYLRTNARGVDINRNFNANWKQVDRNYGFVADDPDAMTYRGPRPKSEPETRAIIRFLNAARPQAVLSYHWLASITGANFLAARSAETDHAYVRRCTDLVNSFVRGFYGKNKHWRAGIQFSTSTGSLPEYTYCKLGVPGFDLEGDGNPDAEPSLTDQTTRSMLETYQGRHYRGLVSMLQDCTNR
jgi:hypothetical protein